MRIAVTGAGGQIGGQVVQLLARTTEHQIVALVRRELSAESRPEQVLRAVADYTDLNTLRAALTGVDALVFVSSDGPVAQVIVHHHNVIRAATESGVKHIVALSGLDADPESPFCYAVSHAYTEQLLYESGCAISIARASIYTEFFVGFLAQARVRGQLRLPAADGRISLVARSDVAHCLAALAVAPPTGRHIDITGPEALDLPAIAAIAERAWRTTMDYIDITPARYCSELADTGEDPWWIYAYSTLFDSVRQQRWGSVSREVEQLTGREPAPARWVLSQYLVP